MLPIRAKQKKGQAINACPQNPPAGIGSTGLRREIARQINHQIGGELRVNLERPVRLHRGDVADALAGIFSLSQVIHATCVLPDQKSI